MNAGKLNRDLRVIVGELGVTPHRIIHVPATFTAYVVQHTEALGSSAVRYSHELIQLNRYASGVRYGYDQRGNTLIVADRTC